MIMMPCRMISHRKRYSAVLKVDVLLVATEATAAWELPATYFAIACAACCTLRFRVGVLTSTSITQLAGSHPPHAVGPASPSSIPPSIALLFLLNTQNITPNLLPVSTDRG